MKDYKKDFKDKLEDGSFCDGELISIANGYITEMQDIITELEAEKDKAWWEGFDTCKAKAGEANVKLSEELETERKKNAELTEQIEELKCCANCKYEEQGYMIEPCKSCNRYFPTLKVGARDKWEKK